MGVESRQPFYMKHLVLVWAAFHEWKIITNIIKNLQQEVRIWSEKNVSTETEKKRGNCWGWHKKVILSFSPSAPINTDFWGGRAVSRPLSFTQETHLCNSRAWEEMLWEVLKIHSNYARLCRVSDSFLHLSVFLMASGWRNACWLVISPLNDSLNLDMRQFIGS